MQPTDIQTQLHDQVPSDVFTFNLLPVLGVVKKELTSKSIIKQSQHYDFLALLLC